MTAADKAATPNSTLHVYTLACLVSADPAHQMGAAKNSTEDIFLISAKCIYTAWREKVLMKIMGESR